MLSKAVVQYTQYSVSGKNVFVISSVNLGQLRWNLVHGFLNKFAAKPYKRFPPHLNNVSTLPRETWNAQCARATTALSEKKTPEYKSHLNCGLQICQILIQLITACGNTAREDVQNTNHWSGWTETATENGVGQAGSCRHCGSHLSVALSIAPDQWCVFCTPSLAILSTRYYQLDSNQANLEATVEVG